MLDLTRENLLKLSNTYGDAFYVLKSAQFQKNFNELSNEFKKIYPNFNIAYSYKTNYTPKLCKIVNENGGYAEVVSDMELNLALKIGVQPSKIIWNGPVKSKETVKVFLLSGGTVNVDSLPELNEIIAIAKDNPTCKLNVGIRCNFDVKDGVVSRFGIDIDSDDFENALYAISRVENIRLINIHCHFAKRNLEYWPLRASTMAKLCKDVAQKIGYMPSRVDIGGGLFGKMHESLKSQFSVNIPSYKEYAEAAATEFAKEFPKFDVELVIEPGSALVGDCMEFVARVESIKTVRQKTFATILGSQKNISMSGVNPPIQVIDVSENEKQYDNVDIVGYTCIEGDVLYHGYSGKLAVGDYIVFSNCGSYSLVMKPPFILPNFSVIDIDGDVVEVIKRQESFDDIFGTFEL